MDFSRCHTPFLISTERNNRGCAWARITNYQLFHPRQLELIKPDRFQILSLDGGGVRGVFTAAILAAIEEDCGVRVADCFDLIAGTSTGGILAIGLGLGFSPREMVQFYVELGPRIFANTLGFRSPRRIVRPKFSAARLDDVLQEKFGDRPFGASTKRLVIPSFNLGENDVYVFRTAHLERLRRDYRVLARHVAMATAAAPTYFPVYRLLDHVRLVDGGVWANNPAMVALTEVVSARHLAIPMEIVHLLTLGTVGKTYGLRKWLDDGGMAAWAFAANDVILDACSIGVTNQVTALLGERCLRVNAHAASSAVRLDDARTVEDLIGSARNISRTVMPQIADSFLKHQAQPFSPHYAA